MTSRETFGERTRTHGMTETRLYSVWCGIKCRCYNNNYKHYDRYGGRGITVCDEWKNSFEKFRDWSFSTGYNEKLSGKEQSLDRINVDGNYEPNNCRWATQLEQARNRGDTVYVYSGEKRIPHTEFSAEHGIDRVFAYRKAKAGFTAPEIIEAWNMLHNTPPQYMTMEQATKHYNVTDMSIRAWIKSGKLKAEKHGQKWYILKGQNVFRRDDRDSNGRFVKGHNS